MPRHCPGGVGGAAVAGGREGGTVIAAVLGIVRGLAAAPASDF
jgi:hypothetical protein